MSIRSNILSFILLGSFLPQLYSLENSNQLNVNNIRNNIEEKSNLYSKKIEVVKKREWGKKIEEIYSMLSCNDLRSYVAKIDNFNLEVHLFGNSCYLSKEIRSKYFFYLFDNNLRVVVEEDNLKVFSYDKEIKDKKIIEKAEYLTDRLLDVFIKNKKELTS